MIFMDFILGALLDLVSHTAYIILDINKQIKSNPPSCISWWHRQTYMLKVLFGLIKVLNETDRLIFSWDFHPLFQIDAVQRYTNLLFLFTIGRERHDSFCPKKDPLTDNCHDFQPNRNELVRSIYRNQNMSWRRFHRSPYGYI